MPSQSSTDLQAPLTTTAMRSMPKIDLHRHLEGSLRLSTLLEIAREYKLDLPVSSLEALRPYVQVVNGESPDVATFLGKFEVLRHFYRSPEVIARLAYEVVSDAAKDNVRYLELRFSPQALTRVQGFSLVEATDWVIEATHQAARDHNIQIGLIITLVRHDPLPQAKKVAEVAFNRIGHGIVGLDLAGDEIKYPPEPFSPLFKEAKQLGLGITVHAGEWAGADGVRKVVEELYVDRIGHGIRAIENSEVVKLVRDRGTTFEVCLTSNLQTGVVHSMHHHPLMDMLDLDLKATLNTDDPTISNICLTDEYQIAVDKLGLSYETLQRTVLNAANAAFLPPAERAALVAKFESWLSQP